VSGLYVAQKGIDVTGHNIANAETEGYSRQVIVNTAYDPNAFTQKFRPVDMALVGAGSYTKILQQIRDQFLDRQYRTETNLSTEWSTRTQGLTYLQALFEGAEAGSLVNNISKFFSAFGTFTASNTTDKGLREVVISNAKTMLENLHQMYSRMEALQESENLTVQANVIKINTLTNNIAAINKQIYQYEIATDGQPANDLRDKRNVMLDQLSQIVNINYDEGPDGKFRLWVGGTASNFTEANAYKYDANGNPKSPVELNNSPNNGVLVVDHVYQTSFVVNEVPMDPPDPSAVPPRMKWQVALDTSTRINVTDPFASPEPHYTLPTVGTSVPYSDNEVGPLDALNPLILFFSADNDNGLELPHQAGNVGGSHYGVLTGGELKAHIDLRDNTGTSALANGKIGIPNFMERLNTLARALVYEVNKIHNAGWTLPTQTLASVTGVDFFYNGGAVDSNGDSFIDDAERTAALTDITAKNIRLSDDIADLDNGAYKVALSNKVISLNPMTGRPETQEGNNALAVAMFALRSSKLISAGASNPALGSFEDYVNDGELTIALTLSQSKDRGKAQEAQTLAVQNSRISVSGVSLDEEMTNLIRYQHAYSGNSRVITVMDDILDTLINRTGRVGL
jgi:flagellar hook-associated protein FlgK